MELRICESLFRRQSEVTRQVVEGISHTHVRMKADWMCVIYAVIQDVTDCSSCRQRALSHVTLISKM